jgi:hypothetical protein
MRVKRWLIFAVDHSGDALFAVYAGVVAVGLLLVAVLAVRSLL